MRTFLLCSCLFLSLSSFAQKDVFASPDSINQKRLIGISTGVGTVWSGSMIGLSQLWYSNVEKSKWHTFDDSKNWLQMDKVGHFYTAYKINHLTYDLFHWTGLKRSSSLWLSSGISFGYQATLEMFDAFSKDWGFSWSDMLGNTLGTLTYTAQRALWDEERIIPKFSYSPTEFAQFRPNILGSNFAESLFKDYNGQTYWLSISPFSFIDNDQLPEWLCFSIGYSAHEKLVGSEEYYFDQISGREFNSSREILFSLDIDFNKLNIKRPWLRMLVKQLNYLKVPFPTLILRNGKIIGSPFYF